MIRILVNAGLKIAELAIRALIAHRKRKIEKLHEAKANIHRKIIVLTDKINKHLR
jgi:hypothetical protein